MRVACRVGRGRCRAVRRRGLVASQLFFLLLVVAVVSEAFRLRTRRFTISAAFLALALAMTLLGPAPAAVLGVITTLAPDLRRRRVWRHQLVDVSTYAFFPLVGGFAFEQLGGPALLDKSPPAYILLVFAVFLAMNVLNFALIALDVAVVEGQSVLDGFRTVYFSLLPVEFASGLLTAGIANAYQGENLGAVALVAVIGLVFEYLLRTALNFDGAQGPARRPDPRAGLAPGRAARHRPADALAPRQMTARHSAAVARYAREIASERGLTDRDQDILHTAALLHDIGKFIFPDSILFASTRLSQEVSRLSAGIRSRARGSSRAWTATAPSPRSCSPTTSGSTARAIRTGSRGSRSPWPRGSSPWPTPTT